MIKNGYILILLTIYSRLQIIKPNLNVILFQLDTKIKFSLFIIIRDIHNIFSHTFLLNIIKQYLIDCN